jgi:cbb3-type cytochrome oxidase cytochrome c subunit
VNEKGCRACHVVNGYGGTIGPDLTEVGDKAPEQYDFSRLSGQRTAFAWHVAHFKDPRALSEGTVMPNFNFTTEQAQALSMLALSAPRRACPYPRAAARRPRRPDGGGRRGVEDRTSAVVDTSCFVCHSCRRWREIRRIGRTSPPP